MSDILKIENMITTKKVTCSKIPLIIGDIHGMYEDLILLLTEQCGFSFTNKKLSSEYYELFSVGDLVDKGEQSLNVLDLEIQSTIGNHDWKILRYLYGRNVEVSEGNNAIDDLKEISDSLKQRYLYYLLSLPLQILINDKYLITHGAMLNDDIDKKFKKALHSNVYGCPTKEVLEDGEPVRDIKWIEDYNLPYTCIYGHSPVREVSKVGLTINIDTGAAFGNKLTAYDPVNDKIFEIKTRRPLSNNATDNPFR